MTRFHTVLSCLAGAALLTGCVSMRPEFSTPLSPKEKEAMMKRAKEPQVFGLTAYSSEQGAVFAGAFRQHEGLFDRITFSSPGNTTAPVIPANERKAMMLIDSAAAESWTTVETFEELRMFPMKGPNPFEKVPRHVYDTTGGFAAALPKLVVGSVHVENAVFYVRNARGPLGTMTRWEKQPYIDGVLGADFLRSFQCVRISLRGREILLSSTQPYPASAAMVTTLPTVELQGGLAVEAIINSERVPVLLDMAGDFEVAMNDPGESTLRQVTLGDIVFRKVQVDSAYELGLGTDSPPRIGRQLLEKYDLVINQQGREVMFERPSR